MVGRGILKVFSDVTFEFASTSMLNFNIVAQMQTVWNSTAFSHVTFAQRSMFALRYGVYDGANVNGKKPKA